LSVSRKASATPTGDMEMAKMTKTEIKVLRAIAEGRREFDLVPECRAIWKMVKKGYIEAEYKEIRVGRFKHYQWGRHWKHVTERSDYIRVKAPKIEAAIAKHGLPLFLRSLAQKEAR
jgi:hypothetical protein